VIFSCFDFRTTEAKSCEVEPTDKSEQSIHKTDDSPVSPSNENKTSKTTESPHATNVASAVMEDDLAENTIRVTHIKENKGDPESSKRSITSPLSVEVGMILTDDGQLHTC
jgi:hypothetical protein